MIPPVSEFPKNDMRPWSVLHVVANHEKRVVQHLAVHSVEHYLPLYSEQSQWSDRKVTVTRPLFAGYVFVRFAPWARTTVISTPGVLHLLGDHDSEMVSAAEIARIRGGLEKGYRLRPYTDVAVGSLVKVCRGFFEGAQGIVAKFCEQCKVVMTLQTTGQRFSLEVDLASVEVLNQQRQL
jgi:transcription antitermination factor NusG